MQQRREHNAISFWRARDLKAELLSGHFSNFSYDIHTHDTACLSLITRGAIRIKMRGQTFTARQGDLYAIEADEPHAGWPVDSAGWNLRTLYVDTAHLRSLVGTEGTESSLDFMGPIINDRELSSLFYGVHRCSQFDGPQADREEQYLAFTTRLFERYVKNGRTDDVVGSESRAIDMARRFIDESLDKHLSLTEMAGAAGLPPFRFYRAFEKSTGMTPHAYQRQARVRLATSLIRDNRPLSEVAMLTGFADQAHLTRWFRRMMGVTPGVFQKAIQ
ncbi:AraC family transcriptional regulator [Natronospirillum operosum]|uniref:AraC family transcriptional regulator n=1 Tax=Natronospirillum operosum TaxID=2759953 RepID=A0A4Z0W7U2_9GAMM|nr:AraC family transcriptional regulator [Natronospirillum operosum]TGG91689.1 AraC family transcriptional regulator [Natronospirillum operosum]